MTARKIRPNASPFENPIVPLVPQGSWARGGWAWNPWKPSRTKQNKNAMVLNQHGKNVPPPPPKKEATANRAIRNHIMHIPIERQSRDSNQVAIVLWNWLCSIFVTLFFVCVCVFVFFPLPSSKKQKTLCPWREIWNLLLFLLLPLLFSSPPPPPPPPPRPPPPPTSSPAPTPAPPPFLVRLLVLLLFPSF